MKSLLLLLSLLVFASVVAARAGDVEEAGAEVVSFSWKYEGYAPVEIVDGNNTTTSLRVTRQKSYVFKYRAQAAVKNTGAKTIKALNWDYLFTDPEDERKELRRYKIQSKQQILPGQVQTLTKELFHDPKESTSHVTKGKQRVLLTRIEYADGTVWKSKDEGGRMNDE